MWVTNIPNSLKTFLKQKMLLALEPYCYNYRWFRSSIGGKWELYDPYVVSPYWRRVDIFLFLISDDRSSRKILRIEDYTFKANDLFCSLCLLHESLFIKQENSLCCPRCLSTQHVKYSSLDLEQKQKATQYINWSNVCYNQFNKISIDDRIDLWHTGTFNCTLPEFLLMTTSEYQNFITFGIIPERLLNYYF